MWRLGFVSLMSALLVAGPVLAQAGRITGTVTSTEGAIPLAGVRIMIAGTTLGTVTSDNGRYAITVQPGTYTVRAVRVGLAPDSVTGVVVTSDVLATVDFQLRPTTQMLTEMVVIGYGEQQARDLTGSIDVVSAEEFNTGRIVSPEELIRAKVPGVQVIDSNEPGGGISLRVRGGTSVNASNEPLFVVDGVPLTVGGGASAGRNPLNFLNPSDIESITVLKDASSTAIYGSRGANGVVIITTKSGISGPQFTYTGTISGSKITGGPDMVSAAQYRAAVQQFAPSNVAALGTANTDWLGAISENAGGVDHNAALSGRREDMVYRLGLGYLDQKGVLRGTQVERVTASLNYGDRIFSDRFKLTGHLKGSRTKDRFTPNAVLGSAVAFAPTQPIQRDDGRFFEWSNTLGPNNPIAELNLVQDAGTTLRSVGNVEGELAIPYLTGLTTTVRAGYDVVRADRTTFSPSTLQAQVEQGATRAGNFTRTSPEQLSTVLDAYLTYDRDLNRFASVMDVTAGYSTERFRGNYPSFYAQGLTTNLLGPYGVPAAVEARPFYNIEESRLVSGFGRVNLTLSDRYLFTATVRRDGSSKFGPANQWGTFPSAAFAWRVLEEPFFRGRTPLSDLKLRLSWGKNGNQAVGSYLNATSYTLGQSTAQAQFGNQFVTTIRPSAFDPDLRWEQTASTNLGLDYGLFDGRFAGTIDYYSKKTTDLLFNVPTAAGTALSNFITTNIGTVRNRGIELGLDATVFDGGARGFSWNAHIAASRNTNELVSINRAGVQRILTGPISGGVGSLIQVLQPGQPVNSFFVYQSRRENGKPVNRDVNGDGDTTLVDWYVDLNNDGIINQDDRRAYKSPAPKWILGHTSNMKWLNFDAGVTLRAYLGNYVYNNVASNLGHYQFLAQANAPVNLHASALKYGFTEPQLLSDVYVEKASFIRMDNLTLGYTFDRLAALERPRIFGTIQNVFTTTGYSGVDPTAGVNGIDSNLYPRSRTFLAGLTVGF